ncbi:MAG: hypothetical protein FWE11_06275 [Defluviitaleaceae bacterium]|nr:hypothetical protein [Defluviitaleaceae bacterium]
MMIKKWFVSVLIALVFILSLAVVVSAEPHVGGGTPPGSPPGGRSIMLCDEIVEYPELLPVCMYPVEDEAEATRQWRVCPRDGSVVSREGTQGRQRRCAR